MKIFLNELRKQNLPHYVSFVRNWRSPGLSFGQRRGHIDFDSEANGKIGTNQRKYFERKSQLKSESIGKRYFNPTKPNRPS